MLKIVIILSLVSFFGVVFLFTHPSITTYIFKSPEDMPLLQSKENIVATSTSKKSESNVVAKKIKEGFESEYTVVESESISKSRNTLWWLSSGGYFFVHGGLGSTIQGALPENDVWRKTFAHANPIDTDDGYYPQNIFRLVLKKGVWFDYNQQLYFKIRTDNLSSSPNRNASNGVLLFNRYQDEFNLYYVGVRVDGYVTIKKKFKGVYYTMAQEPFIINDTYNRDKNPNLIPKNTWIGLRSKLYTENNGKVIISLYMDLNNTGDWKLFLEATDDGVQYHSPVLKGGYAGIRTDFMDVEFRDYSIEEL